MFEFYSMRYFYYLSHILQFLSSKEMVLVSSLRLSSQTAIGKEEQRKINIILKALLQHNEAYDFKQPVDWKGMNLNDYPTIVKHPMDLGTIEKNLKNQKYKFVEQFLDDVQLVWDNCKLYNMAGSWIYEVAEKIERTFKKMIKNYFNDIPITIPLKPIGTVKNDKKSAFDSMNLYGEEDITYFEKLKFCEIVQKLQQQQLQKLIKWIQQKCPQALKDVNQERVQIIVDNLGQIIFQQALDLIHTLAEGQVDRVTKKVKLN